MSLCQMFSWKKQLFSFFFIVSPVYETYLKVQALCPVHICRGYKLLTTPGLSEQERLSIPCRLESSLPQQWSLEHDTYTKPQVHRIHVCVFQHPTLHFVTAIFSSASSSQASKDHFLFIFFSRFFWSLTFREHWCRVTSTGLFTELKQ